MREYELTLVLSPGIADEDVPAEIERVSQLISDKGGTMTAEVNRWGKRRLAYPIEGHREGNYVLAHFKFEPDKAAELERNLESSEGIIRHLLVRLDE